MALIPVFHVVASQFDVDADGSEDIAQGQLVALDATGATEPLGYVRLATAAIKAIGVAGDSRSHSATYTAPSGSALSRVPGTGGQLKLGAWGASGRQTDNRLADKQDEVLASGKMTVYHSGGEFWTDQYETYQQNGSALAATYVPNVILYCSTRDGGALDTDSTPDLGGRFTTENIGSGNWVVGQLIQGPLAYPSGVPGTTTGFTQLPEGGNSMSWGQFIRFKLMV